MAGGPRSSAPSLPHITRRRWRCCQQQRAGASTEPGASRSERYWHRCYCQRAATVNRHRPQEQPCLEGALHVEPAAHTPADCAWTRLCRCPPRCSGHQAHHVSGRGRGGRRGGGGGGCGEPSADAAAAEARHALLGRLQSPERRRARARRGCRHRRALPDPDAPPVPTAAPRPSCKCVPPAHGYPVGLRVAPAPRPCHGGAHLRGDSACELEALQQMARSSSPSTPPPLPSLLDLSPSLYTMAPSSPSTVLVQRLHAARRSAQRPGRVLPRIPHQPCAVAGAAQGPWRSGRARTSHHAPHRSMLSPCRLARCRQRRAGHVRGAGRSCVLLLLSRGWPWALRRPGDPRRPRDL